MYSAPSPRAFRKGSIGVIAQSGAVLLALGNSSREARVFPARFLGKRSPPPSGWPITWITLWMHPKTAVIALFVETIRGIPKA